MNGFVVFKDAEAAERFLALPQIEELKARSQFERSSQDPLIIFRDITPEGFLTLSKLADELGGHTKKSVQYDPLPTRTA
jgi:hypothetical protein